MALMPRRACEGRSAQLRRRMRREECWALGQSYGGLLMFLSPVYLTPFLPIPEPIRLHIHGWSKQTGNVE